MLSAIPYNFSLMKAASLNKLVLTECKHGAGQLKRLDLLKAKIFERYVQIKAVVLSTVDRVK